MQKNWKVQNISRGLPSKASVTLLIDILVRRCGCSGNDRTSYADFFGLGDGQISEADFESNFEAQPLFECSHIEQVDVENGLAVASTCDFQTESPSSDTCSTDGIARSPKAVLTRSMKRKRCQDAIVSEAGPLVNATAISEAFRTPSGSERVSEPQSPLTVALDVSGETSAVADARVTILRSIRMYEWDSLTRYCYENKDTTVAFDRNVVTSIKVFDLNETGVQSKVGSLLIFLLDDSSISIEAILTNFLREDVYIVHVFGNSELFASTSSIASNLCAENTVEKRFKAVLSVFSRYANRGSLSANSKPLIRICWLHIQSVYHKEAERLRYILWYHKLLRFCSNGKEFALEALECTYYVSILVFYDTDVSRILPFMGNLVKIFLQLGKANVEDVNTILRKKLGEYFFGNLSELMQHAQFDYTHLVQAFALNPLSHKFCVRTGLPGILPGCTCTVTTLSLSQADYSCKFRSSFKNMLSTLFDLRKAVFISGTCPVCMIQNMAAKTVRTQSVIDFYKKMVAICNYLHK